MRFQTRAHARRSLYWFSVILAVLFSVPWLGLWTVGDAQMRRPTFRISQPDARVDKLRRERDELERRQQAQDARQRQLLEKNQELLRQQAQVQKQIPFVEAELKKPLSPEDYTAKKCELEDLHSKQEKIQQQIRANQQDLGRLQQDLSQLQQQLSQIRRDITGASREPTRPRTARRPARPAMPDVSWQQAWQQRAWQQQAWQQQAAQRVPDRLSQIMTMPVNPMRGVPSQLIQEKRPQCNGPFAVRTFPGPITKLFDGATVQYGFPFVESTLMTPAEANSASKVIVTFTVSYNSADYSFQCGLEAVPPSTYYFGGSPVFPAGSAAIGTHTFELTPGQFTEPLTGFAFGFTNPPSSGLECTVSNMRVEFYR